MKQRQTPKVHSQSKYKSGVLKNGFRYKVCLDALNDMRLFDYIAELDENPMLFPKVAKIILGEKQKENLYKYLSDSTGRVPADEFSECIEEIFEQIGELKNS